MLVYEVSVNDETVSLVLDVENNTDIGQINFSGSELAISLVKAELDSSYGVFGHQFNMEDVSGPDMGYALSTISFDVSPVQVDEQIISTVGLIPESAKS